MPLQDKHSYLLPVTDIIEEGRNQYYIVEHEGIDYRIKLFDFQRNAPRPNELKCLARADQNDEIYLVQDYSQFIQQFYEIGLIYPFRVVSVHTNQAIPYYQVRDSHGLLFRLVHSGTPYLETHDMVRCRVENINAHRLRLKLVTDANTSRLRFFDFDELCDATGRPHLWRLLRHLMESDPVWSMVNECYVARHGEWILRALDLIDRSLEDNRHRRSVTLLKLIVDLGLYLLEGSDFLIALYEDERAKHQQRLEKTVARYQILLKALSLLADKRDEEFITSVLVKIRQSGYLYNPGENLDLVMAVFTLRPETLDLKMTDILDIIRNGSQSNWMLEPFRSAFRRQLAYYVHLAKERADRASYEDAAGRDNIDKMSLVLALQQLMTLPTDQDDLSVNRAALYRYLSYGNPWLNTQLMDKAFLALTDRLDTVPDFKWSDLASLNGLAKRMVASIRQIPDMQGSQIFEGSNAALHVSGRSISLLPLSSPQKPRAVLPAGLLPWHDIQIYCSERIQPITADESRYKRLHKFWDDIEQSLFKNIPVQQRRTRTIRLHAGDMVDIVVDSILEDGHEFFCHVAGVDTDIEGYLKLHEIVPYNIEGLHLTDFRDSQGNPLRLRAEVLHVRDDGYYDFTLLPYLREYTRETCDTETVFDCRLFKRLDAYYDDLHSLTAPGYVGISSYGDSVLCLFNPANDPGVQSNEVIEASFDHVSSRGQIVCRYIGPADATCTFTHTQAFARLLSEYNAYFDSGVESISYDDDENEPQDSMLDAANVRELIRLIDRVATLEESKVRMFNYLAFCRLLARLIGDESVADYYKRRMSFLDRLKTFLDSGYIDVQTLRLDEDGYMDYPRLQKEILKLKILSYFNYPDRNDELWELSTTSDKVSRLAKLALLSNLSLEFKFTQEIREQINNEVSRLLSIPLQLPSVVTFGEESQTLEFKSSYICPADSLRPDPDRQRDHILQRICGFLNSESGGTLYIGVNNYGVAAGLDEDMKYFHSRDRFDLRVRNDIRTAFGTRVNSLIDGVWADDMFRRAPHRKDVYRLRIRPCSDPVSFGGYYWLRQGTSTYTLELSELRQIMSDRNRDSDAPSAEGSGATDTPAGSSSQPSDVKGVTVDNVTNAAQAASDYASDNTFTTAQLPETTSERFAESFSVGQLRPNPCHDWEENYVVPHCFIHFYGSDGYEVSQQASYETYRSLAVQEHERNTTLVAVYGDGTAIAVPFEEFDEKDRDHRYSRYRDKPLAFACLAHPSDKLLIIYRAGHVCYARLEDISTLRNGSLTDTPQALTTADFDEVIACEIVPLERTRPVRTLLNVSNTSLGRPLTHPIVNEFLHDLGLGDLCL